LHVSWAKNKCLKLSESEYRIQIGITEKKAKKLTEISGFAVEEIHDR
jgi:hypothetical protein